MTALIPGLSPSTSASGVTPRIYHSPVSTTTTTGSVTVAEI